MQSVQLEAVMANRLRAAPPCSSGEEEPNVEGTLYCQNINPTINVLVEPISPLWLLVSNIVTDKRILEHN